MVIVLSRVVEIARGLLPWGFRVTCALSPMVIFPIPSLSFLRHTLMQDVLPVWMMSSVTLSLISRLNPEMDGVDEP